jgi:hypothetical protein
MSVLSESTNEVYATNKVKLIHALQIAAGVILGGLAAVFSIFEIIAQLRKRKSVSIPIEVSRK